MRPGDKAQHGSSHQAVRQYCASMCGHAYMHDACVQASVHVPNGLPMRVQGRIPPSCALESRRCHCRHLRTKRLIQDPPKMPKGSQGKADPLRGEAWAAWLEHIWQHGPAWLYVFALLSEMLCLRPSEALRLNGSDFKLAAKYHLQNRAGRCNPGCNCTDAMHVFEKPCPSHFLWPFMPPRGPQLLDAEIPPTCDLWVVLVSFASSAVATLVR